MPLIGFLAALPAITAAFGVVRDLTKKPPKPPFVPAVLGGRRAVAAPQFALPASSSLISAVPFGLISQAFLEQPKRQGLSPDTLNAIIRSP